MWLIYSYCSIVTEATKYVPGFSLALVWKRQIIQIHIFSEISKRMFDNQMIGGTSTNTLGIIIGKKASSKSTVIIITMSWHFVASTWIDVGCNAQLLFYSNVGHWTPPAPACFDIIFHNSKLFDNYHILQTLLQVSSNCLNLLKGWRRSKT